MNMKEESSFLQGVENRLDSLFGEDTGRQIKSKDPDPPEAAVQDVASESDVALEPEEDLREIPVVKEPDLQVDLPSDKGSPQDKSTFISEIEKRFSAIFGDEDKETSATEFPEKRALTPMKPVDEVPIETPAEPLFEEPPEPPAASPAEPSPVLEKPELKLIKDIDQEAEITTPASSIFHSPLKDMKSVILSIEWEISEPILSQFEDEVNKLYLLYTGDRIIQGFLRILRFLGRYIRVRGVSSNQDSINMLLSVYDHLENVMISEGMTEARKHIILIDNIKKYRSWVENTDLETGAQIEADKAGVEEVPSRVPEPPEEKPGEELRAEDAKPEEESPLSEEKLQEQEPVGLDLAGGDEIPYTVKGPDILVQTYPSEMAETLASAVGDADSKAVMEAIKDMSPHEAFAYALEEIKKTFQSQLDVLKEEIRILKNAR